jgi:hypothetical protein
VQPIYGTTTPLRVRKRDFSFADTTAGLFVSNPALPASTVKTPVATSQVAPILPLLCQEGE